MKINIIISKIKFSKIIKKNHNCLFICKTKKPKAILITRCNSIIIINYLKNFHISSLIN